MNKLISIILIAFAMSSSSTTLVAAVDWELPLTAEDAIIQQELEWAERAMEGYKQKKGIIPTRSSIRAAHVHTEDWRQDSISLLTKSGDFEKELGARALRGRTKR